MVKKPSKVDPAVKVTKSGAKVIIRRPAHWHTLKMMVSLRFEYRSPRGKSRKIPIAKANWLSAGTIPIPALLTPKCAATSPIIG